MAIPATPTGSKHDSAHISHSSSQYDRFTARKKAVIMAVASLSTTLYFLEGSIYVPAIVAIQDTLNTTDLMINFTVTVYSVSSAIMPLVWASISDRYGRRPVYIGANVVCLLSAIFMIFTTNIQMLIGLRFLQGAGASAAFSILAGTISDLYPIDQRGRAYGYSSVGTVLGAVLGPALGGIITDLLGWRHIFTVVAAATGFEIILLYMLVPETLARTCVQEGGAVNSPSSKEYAKTPTVWSNLGRAIKAFRVLRYPFVITVIASGCSVYLSIQSWSSQGFRNQQRVYNLDATATGLWALVFAFANILGSILSGALADVDIKRSARRYVVPRPEDRLWQAALGLGTLMAGLVMVGWCYNYAVDYRIPNTVAFTIIGFGGAMSLNPSGTYLIDIFPDEAATVSSIAYMLRNLVASIAPAVAPLIYTTWAIGIAFACLGMLWTAQYGHDMRSGYSQWSPASHPIPDNSETLKELDASQAETDGISTLSTLQESADHSRRDVTQHERLSLSGTETSRES
ncbi:hypothetical protein HDU93_003002 [Gonapodya sp. JEL0774]|nr:hypothetical protein HDU93_003002 [Gonapodya sp. JEL0774]